MKAVRDETRRRLERRRSAWMQEVQAGDERSFEKLAKDCAPLIRSVAMRKGVQADRADDVVQDVLLTVYRIRLTFDPSRSFDAWLTVIAARRAVDLHRVVSRQYARERHEPVAYDAYADDTTLPSWSMEASERANIIHSVIPLLPPGQREAVQKLSIAEQSLAEVSRATGRSKGSLKVNLHRGIRKLRALLEQPTM